MVIEILLCNQIDNEKREKGGRGSATAAFTF